MTLSSNSDSTYTNTKSITVTLKDTGGSGLAAGSIKYGWSTNTSTPPSSYTTVSTSATTGENTTTFTASGSNLTGSYYLWVVPVKYKDTAGNSNTTTVKSTGTYKFDGTAPTLTLGTVTSAITSITIPITTNSDSHSGIDSTTCVYGTSTGYGKTGTISNNTCTISGLNVSETYYYKITTTDSAGNSTSKTGSLSTNPVILYYNPVTGMSCTNYTTSQSATGVKTGCMKWYAFKEDSTNYTMILDHNTTAYVEWNSDKVNTSNKEVQTELNNLKNVTRWKVTPRLIKGKEIADITGTMDWASGHGIDLRMGCNASTCTSKYYWLYDYTAYCTVFGCKVTDNDASRGYWTSTLVLDDTVMVVSDGWLTNTYASNGNGIRPVITVPKSNF